MLIVFAHMKINNAFLNTTDVLYIYFFGQRTNEVLPPLSPFPLL